jgi:hypothetical protein
MIFSQKTVFGLIAKHSITSTSQCFPTSNTALLERCVVWFKVFWSVTTRRASLLHEDKNQFFAINPNGKLVLFFLPNEQIHSEDTDIIYLGCVKISNSFHLSPGIINDKNLTDSVVTIMDRGHTKSLHLHISASELRDVLADIPNDFNELTFWSDLGFNPQDGDVNTLPVIILLPKILLPSNEFKSVQP